MQTPKAKLVLNIMKKIENQYSKFASEAVRHIVKKVRKPARIIITPPYQGVKFEGGEVKGRIISKWMSVRFFRAQDEKPINLRNLLTAEKQKRQYPHLFFAKFFVPPAIDIKVNEISLEFSGKNRRISKRHKDLMLEAFRNAINNHKGRKPEIRVEVR